MGEPHIALIKGIEDGLSDLKIRVSRNRWKDIEGTHLVHLPGVPDVEMWVIATVAAEISHFVHIQMKKDDSYKALDHFRPSQCDLCEAKEI